MGIIYKLVDPDDGSIRYVGETTRTLEQRLVRHLQQALLDPKNVSRWIWSLIQRGRVPLITTLETVEGTKKDRLDAEARWIVALRAEGHPLMNVRPGARSPEKIAAASRKAWADQTPERRKIRCDNISKALGGDAKRERMFRIVELLRSGPMRYREIVSELGVKSSTLGNDMKDLRSQGLIRREGHTRNAVWHLV